MKRDLSIHFCGIACENPFFLSSSCVAGNYEMCARALEMGWGGIVYKTIGFYKPNEVSPRFDILGVWGRDFDGFRNLEQISDHPLEENLAALRRLKREYPSKILVSSIMGENEEEWEKLAALSEQAGVDIIECNFSCPQMAKGGMGSDVGQNEELVEAYCRAVRKGTRLPILAKMTPNIGNMELPARAAIRGGADGIAAINTVKSITGLDVETCRARPDIDGKSAVSGYSGRAVKPIALRFIHDLAKDAELPGVPLSGIGGIYTWRDALEFIELGVSNIQITTAVMEYGYRIIDDLTAGLSEYMERHGVERLEELVGRALPHLAPSNELRRDYRLLAQIDRGRCVGCGRCFLSCRDGGHQAISWAQAKREPGVLADICVGCGLCPLVCPTQAVSLVSRGA